MNFYEQLMEKLFGDCFEKICYNNTTCLAQIGDGLWAKLQLAVKRKVHLYDPIYFGGIKLEVIDRINGKIDSTVFDFSAIIGAKYDKSNCHIRIQIAENYQPPYWCDYTPTEKELTLIKDKVIEYIGMFMTEKPKIKAPS